MPIGGKDYLSVTIGKGDCCAIVERINSNSVINASNFNALSDKTTNSSEGFPSAVGQLNALCWGVDRIGFHSLHFSKCALFLKDMADSETFDDLKTKLSTLLQPLPKVLFLGVGENRMGDDGAGPWLSFELDQWCHLSQIKIINGGIIPEQRLRNSSI